MKYLIITFFFFFIHIKSFGQSHNEILLEDINQSITSQKTINCLNIEGDSVLWVGTTEGLIKVMTQGEKKFNASKILPQTKISAIAIDGIGNKYIGSYDFRLFKISIKGDTSEIDISNFRKDKDKDELIASIAASKSEVYAATNKGNLFAYNVKTYKSYPISIPEKIKEYKEGIYSIYISRSNLKILCTASGVFSHDKHIKDVQNIENLKWKEHKRIVSEGYKVIEFEHKDGFWLIGRDKKKYSNIIQVIEGNWEEKQLPCNSNNYSKFKYFTANKNDQIWIISQGGLIIYNTLFDTCVYYKVHDSDKKKLQRATSIAYVNDTTIFIGTKGYGFQKVVLKKMKGFVEPINKVKKDTLICNETTEITSIQFDVNEFRRYKNISKAMNDIEKISKFLKENPNATIELHGHTDLVKGIAKKAEAKNYSKHRVEKIRKDLEKEGIKSSRISLFAHGDKHPKVNKQNSLNRRVEIKIICPE